MADKNEINDVLHKIVYQEKLIGQLQAQLQIETQYLVKLQCLQIEWAIQGQITPYAKCDGRGFLADRTNCSECHAVGWLNAVTDLS